MNYIFLNQEEYLRGKIEVRLLTHEYIHVRQFHTLDIIFIEFLLIFFWFHPLFYLYKKAIKLNHEYLADDRVLQQYPEVADYQYLLLGQINRQANITLSSSLNYSLTKQRFAMMNRSYHSYKACAKVLILIPLLSMLTYSFINKSYAQQINKSFIAKSSMQQPIKARQHIAQKDSLQIVKDRYWSSYNRRYKLTVKGDTISKSYHELTEEEKARFPNPPLSYGNNPPTVAQLNDFEDTNTYGVWIDDKQIDNSELTNYQPSDFENVFISKLAKNATNYGKHFYQVNLTTTAFVKQQNLKLLKRLGINPETMKLEF